MLSKGRKLAIEMKVLSGQPVDGSGVVCIHLIVVDEKRGPFVESHVIHQARDKDGHPIPGKVVARPTRCRIACDGKRTPQTKPSKGVVTMLMRSNDPRAVTCPKCIASPDYKAMTQSIEERS